MFFISQIAAGQNIHYSGYTGKSGGTFNITPSILITAGQTNQPAGCDVQANLGNDTVLCPGETLILSAPVANTYLWSTGATGQTIAVSVSGKYWLQVSSSTCNSSDTITVLFAVPQVNLGKDTTLCQGGSFALKSGVANRYVWSTGETTQTISIKTAGQYWVQAFNGGCFKADTINMLVIPLPNVNLGNDTTLCAGQSLTVNAGNASGYLWSTGETAQTINIGTAGQYWIKAFNGGCYKADTINLLTAQPPIVNLGSDTSFCEGQPLALNAGDADWYLWSTGETSKTITVSSGGQYWVKAYNAGCASADTMNLAIIPAPKVNLGNDTVLCQGQALVLNAGSASGYQWSTGATSRTINVNTTNQYWVRVFYGSCNRADTINTLVLPVPQVNLGNDTTICQGQSLALNAGVANSYLWSTGATTQSININSAGQYWIKAYNGGCAHTDTINMFTAVMPEVNLGNDITLCQGETVMLNAGAANSYLWSTGATSQSISVTTQGDYWVKSANSGCFKMDTVTIQYNMPPVTLLPADTAVCNSPNITLNAGKALKYAWSTGDTTQTIKVYGSGTYSVAVNYIGKCTTQYSTIVKFNDCDCKVFMPTAFTPNMDAKNDLFKPAKVRGCQVVDFIIFNRAGQKIFETANADKGWDGTFKGLTQDTGVYVWMVVAVKEGQRKLFKGAVVLMR